MKKFIPVMIATCVGGAAIASQTTREKMTQHYEDIIKQKDAEIEQLKSSHALTIEDLNNQINSSEKRITNLEEAVERLQKEHNAKVDTFEITAYSPYEDVSGLETWNNDADATSTGMPPGPNVVAVDPTVIPYYSTVFIVYENGEVIKAIAGDCGGMIKGNRIDVYKHTYKETVEHGRRQATVMWY